MSTIKHLKTCIVGLFVFSFFCNTTYAQVGIGNTEPTEALDVTGNIKYSGALMPNDDPGEEDQVLVSAGPNTPTKWGMKLLNTGQTLQLGKYFSGLFDVTGNRDEFTLIDDDCTETSTAVANWLGLEDDGTRWHNLHINMVPFDGYWEVYIRNQTNSNWTDMQFAFYAQY